MSINKRIVDGFEVQVVLNKGSSEGFCYPPNNRRYRDGRGFSLGLLLQNNLVSSRQSWTKEERVLLGLLNVTLKVVVTKTVGWLFWEMWKLAASVAMWVGVAAAGVVVVVVEVIFHTISIHHFMFTCLYLPL